METVQIQNSSVELQKMTSPNIEPPQTQKKDFPCQETPCSDGHKVGTYDGTEPRTQTKGFPCENIPETSKAIAGISPLSTGSKTVNKFVPQPSKKERRNLLSFEKFTFRKVIKIR